MCVCVCKFVCVHICMFVYVWKAEGNFGCHSLGASLFCFVLESLKDLELMKKANQVST